MRIVSRPTRGTIPRRTASAAMSAVDQVARPSGAGPQTSATMAASWLLSSMRDGLGRGSSDRACTSPPWR
jgi:hypothetical protein